MFLMDEFIGTTLLACFLFTIPLLISGTSPISPTTENEKNKGLTLKTLFSFRHSKYREPIYRSIPIYGGINRCNNALQMYGCVVEFVCVQAQVVHAFKIPKRNYNKIFLLSRSPIENKAQLRQCPLHFEPASPCIPSTLCPLPPPAALRSQGGES